MMVSKYFSKKTADKITMKYVLKSASSLAIGVAVSPGINVIAHDTEIDAAANPVTVDFFSSKDVIVFLYVVGDDAIPDSTKKDNTAITNNTTIFIIALFFKLIIDSSSFVYVI